MLGDSARGRGAPGRAAAAAAADVPCAYPELASNAPARRWPGGLARVRPQTWVGIYVADAASYVLACHSVSRGRAE